jgi:hypothetical protein
MASAVAAAAVAELPLDYLESKFNSDSGDESQATTVAAGAETTASAKPAAADAGEQPQAQQQGEEVWDEEEDWSDSEDDDLADALEWADSRDGAAARDACRVPGPLVGAACATRCAAPSMART